MKTFQRVFAIVPDCHAQAGHYRPLWQQHFYDGLRGAVAALFIPHKVDFSWARSSPSDGEFSRSAERIGTSELLLKQIKQAQRTHGLDVVISYCFAGDLESELVRRTIQSGIPWINFYCDSTHRFSEIEGLARVVSLNWFPEHAAIPSYRALGVPWVCLPYALNPDFLPSAGCIAPDRSLAFIGLPTANRITQLGLLRLLGCRVEVRGHGWVEPSSNPFHNPDRKSTDWVKVLFRRGLGEKITRRLLWPMVRHQAKGPLDGAEFYEYLRRCQIILGLNQGRDEQGRLASYLKFRDIEFPGYGCCYLTEHNEDVAAAFDVGREVLTYSSIWEASRLSGELSGNLERTTRIGEAARCRVLNEHVWSVRLKQLAERL
jgi:Glycosyl transferases group 1